VGTGLSLKIKTDLPGFRLDVEWSMDNELVVLFGCSGSGKSLTLKTLAGICRQGDGHIELNGRTLFSRERGINLSPQKRLLGYVFQDAALFPHMTIEANVLYGAGAVPGDGARAKARELMELFRLSEHRNKYPGEISGGQKQRAAFARALIHKPEVLLLDEPFSSLDNPLRVEMRRCLTNIIKQGLHVPTILVTHDLVEAITLSDRMLIYSNGKVIQDGRPQTILSHPADNEVLSLITQG
jgi:molybdate transport system ATP-binding protein